MQPLSPVQTENPSLTPAEGNRTSSSESVTTLNLSGHDTSSMRGAADELHRQSLSGARWFFWIAALSMINSIVSLSDGSWNFLAGLGITQFISGLAIGLSQDLGSGVTVVALILDALIAGFFVALGLFAQKGQTWAFIIGLIAYGLDGLIFLLVQDWFPLAFHAFVLYCLFRGWSANNKLKQLQAEVPELSER